MSKILFAVLSVVCAGASAQADQSVFVRPIDPFKNVTRVPNDATEFTVTSVKYVQVATEQTVDYSTCDGVNTEEPGGSQYCPSVTDSNKVQAVEIDFSYKAPSTADEYGNTYNEDYFYLNTTALTALQIGKIPAHGQLKGAAAEAVVDFRVAVASEPGQAIDMDHSKFCETVLSGDYYVKADPSCVDQVVYKTVQYPYTVASATLK